MIIGKTDFIQNLYKDYSFSEHEYEKKYRFKLFNLICRIGNEINKKHLVINNY